MTAQAVQARNQTAAESHRRLDAMVQVAHQRTMDRSLANDLLLALEQFSQDEQSYCNALGYFRDENEIVLTGRKLDIEEAVRESKRGN